MSYRIIYGQASGKQYPPQKRKSRLAAFLPCALLAFVLLTRLFWPKGTEALRELLIPGDNQATTAAFSTLAENVQQGAPLPDALRAFCREILNESEDLS